MARQTLSVTIPSETLADVKKMAETQHRSLSSMVSVILIEAIKREQKKTG